MSLSYIDFPRPSGGSGLHRRVSIQDKVEWGVLAFSKEEIPFSPKTPLTCMFPI